MIRIRKSGQDLVLDYEVDFGPPDWIDERLSDYGSVTLAKTFHFKEKHKITSSAGPFDELLDDEHQPDEDQFHFHLGVLEDQYYRIDSQILGTDSDVLFHRSVPIDANTFTAHRGIAIFPKISRLVKGEIVIGGDAPNAIPTTEFQSLLSRFPGSTELTHYARSKIARVLREYLDLKSDPEKQFESYLNRREKQHKIKSASELFEFELHKYVFIRDQIIWMLKHAEEYSEADWQGLMLDFILVLFPKYVHVLREVRIRDFYTRPGFSKDRKIDLALLDATGNLDIIEIKKPFESCLVSSHLYRDNFIPRRELSGTVMQVEKYLFHLNKWGVQGEKEITAAQLKKGSLPKDMSVRITNPKAMIIAGRSNNLSEQQLFDFEIMKRQYANLMDIMSYDDLLARLSRIIEKFSNAPPTTTAP